MDRVTAMLWREKSFRSEALILLGPTAPIPTFFKQMNRSCPIAIQATTKLGRRLLRKTQAQKTGRERYRESLLKKK